MKFIITNATNSDVPKVYQLFEEAILFQKRRKYIGWKNYDKEFVKADIQNGLLFKIINTDDIVGIFSICYSDPLIWREKEKGNALYIHRTVLNQNFKGEKIFNKILNWAITHAGEKKLKYIRIDTWADNEKIIEYYKSYGFSFKENYTTPDTDDLPTQHRNLKVALMEFKIPLMPEHNNVLDSNKDSTLMANLTKVNIGKELSTIDKYWDQKIIGQANGQLIKLAKGTGEINWHKHDDQDELFILYKGHLTIQLRDKNIELYKDDMFIIPKGVEHCPRAHGDVEFLIMGLNITSNAAGGRPENWALKGASL